MRTPPHINISVLACNNLCSVREDDMLPIFLNSPCQSCSAPWYTAASIHSTDHNLLPNLSSRKALVKPSILKWRLTVLAEIVRGSHSFTVFVILVKVCFLWHFVCQTIRLSPLMPVFDGRPLQGKFSTLFWFFFTHFNTTYTWLTHA